VVSFDPKTKLYTRLEDAGLLISRVAFCAAYVAQTHKASLNICSNRLLYLLSQPCFAVVQKNGIFKG
jgi:hypothetical protein